MTELRTNKGWHSLIERDIPYIFIDACMQAWPDAAYHLAHRHGVTAYAVTAWDPHADVAEALEGLMFWHLVARRHEHLGIAKTAEDIRAAKREGKSVFILASQCGAFIGRRLHRLEAFYQLGLRMLILAYSYTNHLCDGCLDDTDFGLTKYGALVVDECDRLGMLLDCSHVGKKASLEIIERSKNPVVFSHTGVNAVVDNPRNIDDYHVLACTQKGGIVCLAPWGPLCLKAGSDRWPTLDDLLDQIDHVVQLVGSTKHVGIGTDFSLGTYPDHWHDPWGEPEYRSSSARYDRVVTADVRSPQRALADFHEYPQVVNLIDKLQARGYSEEDIAGILGENLLRVFEQIWK